MFSLLFFLILSYVSNSIRRSIFSSWRCRVNNHARVQMLKKETWRLLRFCLSFDIVFCCWRNYDGFIHPSSATDTPCEDCSSFLPRRRPRRVSFSSFPPLVEAPWQFGFILLADNLHFLSSVRCVVQKTLDKNVTTIWPCRRHMTALPFCDKLQTSEFVQFFTCFCPNCQFRKESVEAETVSSRIHLIANYAQCLAPVCPALVFQLQHARASECICAKFM